MQPVSLPIGPAMTTNYPPAMADSRLPAVVNFTESVLGNEDCLFLNVFAPTNAKKLPVLVWLHGGGYGLGSAASFDFSYIAQTVNNGFITVVIQYRLGAFGFLSSAELVKNGGVPNAALHDQRFALQWVKKYIDRFGGDPDQVTISGGSAGGGSVMLLAMANGGTEGTSLFRRGIASSPYLPTQPNFDDPLPTEYYHQLARRANCLNATSIFTCLEQSDTLVLQNASSATSYSARFNQWAFIPVTDNNLILASPTDQLPTGKVNGEAILAGSNSNEGYYFTPQNITTESSFLSFLTLNYPVLSPDEIASILSLYTPSPLPSSTPLYETNGLTPPFATELSAVGKGWQQAANNLYAETTFVCTAYWLNQAYSGQGKRGWQYQFSPPGVGFHGSDNAPLLQDPAVGRNGTVMDEEFRRAFQGVWGRFITQGDPTVEASGQGVAEAVRTDVWKAGGNDLLNLNVTVTASGERQNRWAVVDADEWEGGRGERCRLWADIGFR
ncbi:Alpha/Beta hydrolase protein [Triangularia verruculosa]|uniref:Carboxylic ester hydrolase n=1 Tax=Triangularia verruculosa TaxID=2587418 RepID=A0AAN7B210_9PEZI|nr:Alpha/Beta hydrolase protein [Triangularia verruculosa]